ncbi:Hypothetical predicted protein [Olea europaea subsp. europaea]|uniref:Uncharacterized protein n=1 Tax=Olea europaea subsp. europaea TaxID=158383 RepID=A0A8S0SFE9_OLEEU|nr:Hypothetical predicted protein [Olea europaea subsp. europaea]
MVELPFSSPPMQKSSSFLLLYTLPRAYERSRIEGEHSGIETAESFKLKREAQARDLLAYRGMSAERFAAVEVLREEARKKRELVKGVLDVTLHSHAMQTFARLGNTPIQPVLKREVRESGRSGPFSEGDFEYPQPRFMVRPGSFQALFKNGGKGLPMGLANDWARR